MGPGRGGLNLYLESSAALRDILEGASAGEVRDLLRSAHLVVTSRLTIAEVGRVLARLRVLDPSLSARVAARESAWLSDSELWAIEPVDDLILARCSRPFPHEPVRMLDAVHLATAERLSSALPDLVVLSTDERIRHNAEALGFVVRP
jgi:predicted nucleic acid-binding protein